MAANYLLNLSNYNFKKISTSKITKIISLFILIPNFLDIFIDFFLK